MTAFSVLSWFKVTFGDFLRDGTTAAKNFEETKQAELWYENEIYRHRKGRKSLRPIVRAIQVQPAPNIIDDFINTAGSEKENFKSGPTFHQAIRPLLALGQCFGLIPVKGVGEPFASSLQFKILDIRTFYTCVIIMTGVFMALVNIYWISSQELQFDNMSPLIWFGTHSLVYSAFTVIAKRWPKLMIYWEEIEHTTSVRNVKQQENLTKSIRRTTLTIFLLATLEHLLSIINGFYTARKCKNMSGVIEGYFRQSFPAYYFTFPYNLVSGCFWQILNLYFAFAWNFTDSFVIIMSMGLRTQFQQFNDYIHRFRGQVLPPEFWDDQRRYYTALSELLNVVDSQIAIVVLISFSTNLYYVCLQLFNSVNPGDTIIRAIYFWYSLFFLIGRTLAVSFCASKIHDESKKPIGELRLIPTESFTKETKRLLEQIANSTIALSGFNFFHVTRQFILNVAGTIVTYELVLVQLHRGEAAIEDPCAR